MKHHGTAPAWAGPGVAAGRRAQHAQIRAPGGHAADARIDAPARGLLDVNLFVSVRRCRRYLATRITNRSAVADDVPNPTQGSNL